MKFLTRLPWILAAINCVCTTIVFGFAICSPERNGLLPILIYFFDMPVSIILELFSEWLRGAFNPSYPLVVDYLLYVVTGFAWFFLIGVIFRYCILRLKVKR
jgi:hypothetical protein